MAFVHLHTHSEYSLLDGANRIPELLDRVQALGMDSLAITDHGNLHGAWQFYSEARAGKFRPILGFEAYLALGDRHKRERPPPEAPGAYSHLVLLARNRTGYQNLVKLSSIGFLEGFYRRPRIDRQVLEQYSDGLIGLAACLSGEIALYLRQGNYEAAKASAQYFARVFGPPPGGRGGNAARGELVRIRLREALLPSAVPAPRRVRVGQRPARASGAGGGGGALRRPPPPGGPRAARLRAAGDLAHRLRGLLPDRLRHRQGGEGPRHSGGAGARLGGGLARGIRARHHGYRSPQVRPAVRAVPESRAHFHAGHRPRLLLRAARRGDPVHPGALWARLRRSDHHVRHAQGPRRIPRRRPDAAGRAGRGGPLYQDDPRRAGHLGDAGGSVREVSRAPPARPPGRARPQDPRARDPDRGPGAPRLGARRGRGDRPRAAHRLRPRLPRAAGGGGDHHPVRHGGARAGGDAEDRRARPAHADRDP